jgi:hypothetical protein
MANVRIQQKTDNESTKCLKMASTANACSYAYTQLLLLVYFPYFKKKEAYVITLLSVCPPANVARQRLVKQDTATNTHTKIEQLLDAAFSRRSVSDPSSHRREGPSPKHVKSWKEQKCGHGS